MNGANFQYQNSVFTVKFRRGFRFGIRSQEHRLPKFSGFVFAIMIPSFISEEIIPDMTETFSIFR